ncbi:MAG TPA: ribonuclease PH [Vicinamibacteria bacterium]|nr:ribonuclease PH [Vicinamibacteria bacterium]
MKRVDGRRADEPRPCLITPSFLRNAEGSALIEIGETKVICAATLEERVPPFLKGKGSGWITAEYGMLPRSSHERIPREAARGKVSGRTQEIQRLIGRSLRAIVDLSRLGERTVWIDCDVLQADGGTRTASISGAFVALALVLKAAVRDGAMAALPIRDYVAATSVGVVERNILLDLNYREDARAEVDMNIVMTGQGNLIEVQGTAESSPFSRDVLLQMVKLAAEGVDEIVARQREVLGKLELIKS